MRIILAGLAVFLELFFLLIGAIITFVITSMLTSAEFAEKATDADWWIASTFRIGLTIPVIMLMSYLVYLGNTYLFNWSQIKNDRIFAIISGIIALIVLSTTGVGGIILFLMERPHS